MAEPTTEINPKRHVFLYIIGGLSIISQMIMILIYLILLSGITMKSHLMQIPVIDTIIEEAMHGNNFYFLIRIALHAFCIYAVLLLLRFKRRGFFYYLVVQIILLLIPFIFLKSLGFSYILISSGISAIFSFFFIMLFSLYLPHILSKNKNP